MNRSAFFLVAGMCAGGALFTNDAAARPTVFAKGDAKKGKAAAEPGPAEVSKKVKLSPDGLRFGMTVEEISSLYEKVFEEEFVPLYKAVEPGPRMAELDAELAERKRLIMHNRLEFGALPSGLDQTPLAGEYTYNNGESMSQIKLRSGVQRYFFFFGNHLWKVYDVHKLGKKSKLGADIESAVEGLTKAFGKAPRSRKADPGAKRYFDQVDWQDKETVVRVIDHGNGSAGVAYIDRKTEESLDRFRTHKGAKDEVDHDVSDATRGSDKGADPKKK